MDDENKRSRLIVTVFVIMVVIIIVLIAIFAIFYNSASDNQNNDNVNDCSSVAPPNGVSALSFQITKVKVTWNPAPNASRYQLYVGTISDFNTGNAIDVYRTSETEYIVDNLVLGRTYYFFVTTSNSCGNESVKSTTVTATTGYPDD